MFKKTRRSLLCALGKKPSARAAVRLLVSPKGQFDVYFSCTIVTLKSRVGVS